jgi:hypothetical protein
VSEPPPPPSVPRWGWGRWLPALLVPVALLPDLAAALPLRTYYFRDFTATFYPLRLFAAREMREGRFPVWNPFIFEGSFQTPALYPPDLLHLLWPSPVFVSWLLTLHLPLAALAAWWLARELGASREGAFVGGAVYALGGFALSTLNLYVFLQALALAPIVAGLLRRAARAGGRSLVIAAAGVALALSTLAVEFVAQAVLLGVVLGLVSAPGLRAGLRLLGAGALGIGLAGLPLALTLGLLPETARGVGFAADVRLGNAVHPAVLLQSVLPNLFGVPQLPAEAWWGGRFFSKGLPYFLSLYVGPVALALAGLGFAAMARTTRAVLLALGGLALWYSLGEWGGLAPLLANLPLAEAFRFPSKAVLLPYLALALAAAFGVDRLRREREAWRRLAVIVGAAAVLALALAGLFAAAPPAFVSWTGVLPAFWPRLLGVIARDAAVVLVVAAACGGLAAAVHRDRLGIGVATALVSALAVGDLVRAGSGLNPQVPASFFDPLPEIAALRLDDLGGQRVFSYGLDHSPAFGAFLSRGGEGLTLAGTFLSRQVLSPYSNILDRVEAPEATDLTSFVPRVRELGPENYEPGRVGRLLPWLRNAAVGRVVSLDPLSHPDLESLAVVPAAVPGVAIYVYRLSAPWPRSYVACRAAPAPSVEEALGAPYREGFDPWRDVSVEGEPSSSCREGESRRLEWVPGAERYAVETDGAGYLVTRDSFARGWRAWVDGVETPVRRANGKHRAVSVPAGAHEVVLRYEPPGWKAGLLLTGLSVVAGLALWMAPVRGRRRR